MGFWQHFAKKGRVQFRMMDWTIHLSNNAFAAEYLKRDWWSDLADHPPQTCVDM